MSEVEWRGTKHTKDSSPLLLVGGITTKALSFNLFLKRKKARKSKKSRKSKNRKIEEIEKKKIEKT